MPNWTSNVIRFGGKPDKLEEVKVALSGKDTAFDFSRLIPMPDSIAKAEESTTTQHGVALLENNRSHFEAMLDYGWVQSEGARTVDDVIALVEEKFPNARELGRINQHNRNVYGFSSWYDWCRHNWGTKWNACDVGEWIDGSIVDWEAKHNSERAVDGSDPMIHYAQLQFDTAWCFPEPIILKLQSDLAPSLDLAFDHWFSDEDGGSAFDPTCNKWLKRWEHNVESDILWNEV